MAKPIVIEDVESQPSGLREAIRRAEEAQYGKKRAGDMALIDTALKQKAKEQEAAAAPAGKPKRVDPRDGPGLFLTPAELVQQERLAQAHAHTEQSRTEAREKQDKKALAAAKEAERIRQAQQRLLGKEEAERLEQQEEEEERQRQSLLGVGQAVLDRAAEARDTTTGAIASLPTPGSLWFPLVLLLLFFFILITYNGHTRLYWLWLVLTGNAGLGKAGAGASGNFGGPGAPVTDAFNTPPAGQGAPVGGSASGDFGNTSSNGVYGSPF